MISGGPRLAGLIGDHVAYEGIFYLLAVMCGASIVATLMIRRDEIDNDLARGADGVQDPEYESYPRAPRVARLGRPETLVAVQLLDGVGAGIFGVVGVLVIADLTRGTGRSNFMQGALATATGLGASASRLLTGVIVCRRLQRRLPGPVHHRGHRPRLLRPGDARDAPAAEGRRVDLDSP